MVNRMRAQTTQSESPAELLVRASIPVMSKRVIQIRQMNLVRLDNRIVERAQDVQAKLKWTQAPVKPAVVLKLLLRSGELKCFVALVYLLGLAAVAVGV